MRTLTASLLVLTAFSLAGCETTNSSSGSASVGDGPLVLKIADKDVPAEVRQIEVLIDRPSALLADEVRIEISKNYEWDVSLTGDLVSAAHATHAGMESTSTGAARAHLRQLDIRARDKIVLWRSGFGVTPFIRVTARGNVSYIDGTSSPTAMAPRRGKLCVVRNAVLAFDDEAAMLLMGAAPDGMLPVGVRDNAGK